MEEPVKKKVRRGAIVAAVLKNEVSANRLQLVELAEAIGAPPRSVYRVVSRLRKEGKISRPDGTFDTPAAINLRQAKTYRAPEPAASADPLDTPPSQWDEDALAAIDKLPILDAEQRKKLLSGIAMRPSAGVGQAAALKTLEDIDKGAGTQVGPPAPLTEDGQIERLSRLMRAVGPEITRKAMEAAFEHSNQRATTAHTDEGGQPSAS